MDDQQRKASFKLTRHLQNLAIWSVGGVAVGVAIGGLSADPWLRSFGAMHAGWCAVNLAIALPGLLRPKPIDDLAKLREFLALNLGLNVAYIGIGGTMMTLGRGSIHAFGAAIVVNGLALLALDAWLMSQLPKFRTESGKSL